MLYLHCVSEGKFGVKLNDLTCATLKYREAHGRIQGGGGGGARGPRPPLSVRRRLFFVKIYNNFIIL